MVSVFGGNLGLMIGADFALGVINTLIYNTHFHFVRFQNRSRSKNESVKCVTMFRRTIGRTNHYVRFRGRGTLPPIPIRNVRADQNVGYDDEDPDIYIEQDEDQGSSYDHEDDIEEGEEENEFEEESYEAMEPDEDEQTEVSFKVKQTYLPQLSSWFIPCTFS